VVAENLTVWTVLASAMNFILYAAVAFLQLQSARTIFIGSEEDKLSSYHISPNMVKAKEYHPDIRW